MFLIQWIIYKTWYSTNQNETTSSVKDGSKNKIIVSPDKSTSIKDLEARKELKKYDNSVTKKNFPK